MGMLVLDRSHLDVRLDGDALALYQDGERRTTVPVALLERVVIQGSRTRLDSGVLTRLAEEGAAILLLSPRASRKVALVLGPRHNDATIRMAQSRLACDPDFCSRWATDIVRAKLRRQHRVLLQAQADRPDVRKPLFDATATLTLVLRNLSAHSAPSVESLRGFEGTAARAYFQGLAALFAPALAFSGRNRRPPRDPVNACLSLAYTLMHFEAVRAAHVAGLDPLIGFYHRPAYGRESLASDLIEPLRPTVDRWIWDRFRDRTFREEHFTRTQGACLLGKAGRERLYSQWESCARSPRRWLRQRTLVLARALRHEGEAWVDHLADDDIES